MLNKDLVLVKDKIVSDILIGYAYLASDIDANMWPAWSPEGPDGSTPFWEFAPNERASGVLIDGEGGNTHVYFSKTYNMTAHTLTFTNLENGLTATFTVDADGISNIIQGDVFRLSDYAFEKVRMKVYPPPQDTSKTYFKSSMEESVDDKQGIIDDERCRGSRECYYQCRWSGSSNSTFSRRGKALRRELRTSNLKKRHGGFYRLRIDSVPIHQYYSRHSKRRVSHHTYFLGCCHKLQIVRGSKLTQQEALYA